MFQYFKAISAIPLKTYGINGVVVEPPIPSEIILSMPFTVDSSIYNFGSGLDSTYDGSRTVIGSDYKNTQTTQTEAPVFVYLNGVLEATLTPSYATTNHGAYGGTYFGSKSVSISNSGDVIGVGAYGYDANPDGANYDGVTNLNSNNGALYVFRRSGVTWSQEAFIPSPRQNNDQMGRRVKVSGDGLRIAILATGYTYSASNVSVYRYDVGNWVLEFNSFIALVAANAQYLEIDFNYDGSVLVASDGYHQALCIYRRTSTTWTTSPVVIDGLGLKNPPKSIRLSGNGNVIVAGSPEDDVDDVWGTGQVAIIEYNGSSWGSPYILQGDSTIIDGGYFGEVVDISNDGLTVAVGFPGYSNAEYQQGGVKVFNKVSNAWTPIATHFAATAYEWDNLGYNLTLSGNGSSVAAYMPTGTPASGTIDAVSGKVYLFYGSV